MHGSCRRLLRPADVGSDGATSPVRIGPDGPRHDAPMMPVMIDLFTSGIRAVDRTGATPVWLGRTGRRGMGMVWSTRRLTHEECIERGLDLLDDARLGQDRVQRKRRSFLELGLLQPLQPLGDAGNRPQAIGELR